MAKRILVLGGAGQIARELGKIGPDLGVCVVTIGRERADLTQADPAAMLDAEQPDAVINAAAYTAVDRAEDEADAAFALNAAMPGGFAGACAARNLPFVHISTDYVFDGTKPTPYVENDPIAPIGAYGRSKAEGERLVLKAGGRAAILRTAWVYSAFGANFVKTMLRLAETRDEIGVVADQRGCPTWAEDVARAALLLIAPLSERPAEATGVFHAAGGGEASWAEFAAAIFEASAARGGPSARVRSIATADYPTRAARPANSRLACDRLEALLGWRPGEWRRQLELCLDELTPAERI